MCLLLARSRARSQCCWDTGLHVCADVAGDRLRGCRPHRAGESRETRPMMPLAGLRAGVTMRRR